MSADWKEVYVIPAIDEEVPENSILLIDAATGNQMIHAIVPIDYTTDGTLLWERYLFTLCRSSLILFKMPDNFSSSEARRSVDEFGAV